MASQKHQNKRKDYSEEEHRRKPTKGMHRRLNRIAPTSNILDMVAAKMRPDLSGDERPRIVKSDNRSVEDFVTAQVFKEDATVEGSNDCKVVVELKGAEVGKQRPCGLDLVLVLEVSGQMTKLKCAIKFLMKKLSPIDSLSIIISRKIATTPKTLCPLQSMTDSVRLEVERLVDSLKQPKTGGTDIIKGLHEGLQVLKYRTQKDGRTSAIMLISYEKPSEGITTKMSKRYDVPVHTFGVGDYHDAKVLRQVAKRSENGTFSSVVDLDGSGGAGLSIAMSTCLAGLLTEVVQELKLNISSEMKINKIYAGSYQQRPEENGSVTIPFGNLYCSEKRRVLVDVKLPEAHLRRPTHAHVFTISYSFRASGGDKKFVSPAIHTSVQSTYNASVSSIYSSLSPEYKVVAVEDARRKTMVRISKAVRQECDVAKKSLEKADTMLSTFDERYYGSEMINELKYEVWQLQNLVENNQILETAGYSFGVASALSHNRQRFAFRGEADENIIRYPAYVTPIANLFAQQAREFDSNYGHVAVPKIEQVIEKLLAPNHTRTIVVNNHQDGVSSGNGSVVTTDNKSDYETLIKTFLKKFYANGGWKRKNDKNSNKAVLSMALLLLWFLFVIQGKHEGKSEYFESITRFLKALTNLVSAIQVLLPGEETIWSLVIEYFI